MVLGDVDGVVSSVIGLEIFESDQVKVGVDVQPIARLHGPGTRPWLCAFCQLGGTPVLKAHVRTVHGLERNGFAPTRTNRRCADWVAS